MPMWTDLGAAFAGTGLRVVEHPGWRTRGHGTPSRVTCVICHHTAGPASGETPSLGVVVNGRAGLAGPLCNLYLSRSGVVHLVAAGVGWHAGACRYGWASNQTAVGIEAEATGVSAWPQQQYDAYVLMCRALIRHYGLPVERVLGHKESCAPPGRKIDPNFDMNAFRRAIASGAALAPPTAAAPRRRMWDDMTIERQITPGKDQFMRIVCPVGRASGWVKEGWVSISAGGGFTASVGFQVNSDTDAAPPGAGPVWKVSGNNANRRYSKIPDGCEYLDINYSADGPGSVLVELIPR